MRILVTGGAGYIGSHTCVELLQAGHEVVVVDNLCNGSLAALRAVEVIAGRTLTFYPADIRDRDALADIFATEVVDAVFHFAALKAVGESVTLPLRYFDNNIGGLITLCQIMVDAGVRTFVFSSSATVYGVPERVPVAEDAPVSVTNPYGRTKLVNEEMLRDLQQAVPALRVALLRYFNPGGAHPSGLLGESPHDIPNNLLPFVSQVAAGQLDRVQVHGDDYATADGTGVRDYIHVVDLARGHIAALDTLLHPDGDYAGGGVLTMNLGTGRGYSVLEIIRAFERASGCAVPYVIGPRRPGDVASCYADPALARELMGWTAEYGIDRICADAWRWQQMHPGGYLAEGHAA
ncbi:UDP-glucose 4-epimerase GalE [Halofilum ochraceum]|uniref:UDP-glucose 4-epimerase GalE n=1 Tax=Halofilum ochraceum TaxID=1611323 RepID=UPI00082C8769|nr:UDP-glucose 4-epimerase GalE [Halofilum ochraceum]